MPFVPLRQTVIPMFRNYIKTALRNIAKSRFYSSLNIVGLAVGLATCLLILVYVLDELNYDRYNLNADRIYRVDNEIKFGNNHLDLAVCAALQGITMVREMPQVQQYTRLKWHGNLHIRKGMENLSEGRVAFADSTLFEVFTIPVISGNAKTALKEYHSLVITETIAKKYFNSTDVVGKTILINDTAHYKITAVIKDIPKQSHFNFDVFVPMVEDAESNDDNWLSQNWNTYILLKQNTEVKQVQARLNPFMNKHIGPQLKSVINQSLEEFEKSGGFIRGSLTPLTAIHLHSNKIAELDGNGNAEFVYIFSAIAFLILLIACVNFMNLSTARSSNRAKEVGVRKVLGSLKTSLVWQFLTESLLISFISLLACIFISWLLLPYFNQLTGKNIQHTVLFQPAILLCLVSLMLVVGLLAGSYPAFFLASFQPIDVLKGKLAGGFKRSWLRSSLVVVQFVISIILIFGTVIIYSQLNYIHHKDIGFNRNQIITIYNTNVLGDRATSFKNELLQINGIQSVTVSGYLPVNYYRSNNTFFTSTTLDPSTGISMQSWTVDENYIPTLDIKLMQGRNFSPAFLTDSSAMVINEAAAKFLGGKDILSKKLYTIYDLQTKKVHEYHIIGIIKNFHFSSLRAVVTPLAFFLGKDRSSISARIRMTDIPATIGQIKNKWKSMAASQPFEYSFMDDDFNKLYTTEERTGQIFVTFAVLAILIACLGLFGLITYAAEQRVKEIGIRKVLGANVTSIVSLISKDFLVLICIASLFAFPVAWWAMRKWLQDFAYRVDIGWEPFAFAGIITVFIAMITISFQAVKAATANPVNSIRTE